MSRKKEFTVNPFEKLRKALERHEIAAPVPIIRKKKKDFTDDELFCQEMNDVLAIEEFRSLACEPRPRKDARSCSRRDPDEAALSVLQEIVAGSGWIHLPDTQEYIEWINPAHQDTLIEKLHAGHYSVQAFLDLHGRTVPEAEEELGEFLQESFKKGRSCVKIIHGRGLRSVNGARLKNMVAKRLMGHFRRDIAAFVTARQCDGGLGALYVLLTKK